MTQRVATCVCGQLKVLCTGEPVRISMCHCLECQKRSGSPFGVQARFPQANVEVTGTFSTYKRGSDDQRWVAHHFCPTCGTTVFYALEAVPGHFGVPVGGFADPTFPPPRFSVYDNRRHPWVKAPEGVEVD
jgi:hypothetical protein